jgi:hypothetical protein
MPDIIQQFRRKAAELGILKLGIEFLQQALNLKERTNNPPNLASSLWQFTHEPVK